MEPPGEGRYELLHIHKVMRTLKPQWSRPVKGGTSGRYLAYRYVGILAAMEPPGEGRYEVDVLGPTIERQLAAMEPPGEGRYERRSVRQGTGRCRAAMEPPGEGRYELVGAGSVALGSAGRNGAAR